MNQAIGVFGDIVATQLVQVSKDPSDLDEMGWWAVTQTFEGEFTAFRFANITSVNNFDFGERSVPNIPVENWVPSLNAKDYMHAVEVIRNDIAKGWVYQANLCYVLSCELKNQFDPIGFWQLLAKHNPAPFLSGLYVPASESGLIYDVAITSASPELFLSRVENKLISSPIKGTAKTSDSFLEKDRAENVMIVDLIRNDLSQICMPGSVEVTDLLRIENHPGLVHLVSDVCGEVRDDISWNQILKSMLPPGSVSGAPKSSALEVINRLEPVKREIYCGTFGYVDATKKNAKLAVGIRTFWQTTVKNKKFLNFGTGAGITWGSDPHIELAETELKAKKLLEVASFKK